MSLPNGEEPLPVCVRLSKSKNTVLLHIRGEGDTVRSDI